MGDYTAAELAAGVNLAVNPKTPQFRQSEALCQVNEERHALSGDLRALPQLRHGHYGDKVDPNDPAAVEQFLHAEFENRKPGDHWEHHLIEIFFSKVCGHQDELNRRYAELVAKMERDRIPKPHQFRLSPTEK